MTSLKYGPFKVHKSASHLRKSHGQSRSCCQRFRILHSSNFAVRKSLMSHLAQSISLYSSVFPLFLFGVESFSGFFPFLAVSLSFCYSCSESGHPLTFKPNFSEVDVSASLKLSMNGGMFSMPASVFLYLGTERLNAWLSVRTLLSFVDDVFLFAFQRLLQSLLCIKCR